MARRKSQNLSNIFLGKSDASYLLNKCRHHLLQGTLPDEKFDRGFIRELMWAYFKTVKDKRPTGREIAAMVDYHARQTGSIKKGIKFVNEVLALGFSVEAIEQHHKRYGKRLPEIKKTKYVSSLGFSETPDGDFVGWISRHELESERDSRIAREIEEWRQSTLRSTLKKVQLR
jgi:hypothetical protein